MRRRRRRRIQKVSPNQLKISEMVKHEKQICLYLAKNSDNSLMGMQINLKIREFGQTELTL